jgi:flagellar motility protein MotE (MotC chaperone)
MTKQRKRKSGRGTLGILAFLLIGSGLLRASLGAGEAFARAQDTGTDVSDVASEPANACEPPADVALVLEALDERENRVQRREAQLRGRMRALALAEEEIAQKTSELIAAEEALRETIALADSAAEDDIARLVSVYQAMKPKDAAALFETMDPEFAAGFLGRMQPEAAAGIMAGLDPQTAYSVSVILAGRNATVPTE